MLKSVEVSSHSFQGATPHTAHEIAGVPVEVKFRLPRKVRDRIRNKSMTRRLTLSGMLRHLILTHPMMQEEDKPC
jgi:hypothetical protein